MCGRVRQGKITPHVKTSNENAASSHILLLSSSASPSLIPGGRRPARAVPLFLVPIACAFSSFSFSSSISLSCSSLSSSSSSSQSSRTTLTLAACFKFGVRFTNADPARPLPYKARNGRIRADQTCIDVSDGRLSHKRRQLGPLPADPDPIRHSRSSSPSGHV
ncbi:hypothetical protein OG21DRAFT_1244448 [Imleria badia]|nr:hypothetical protein OG21DRAFT_1244448 [Imleria badia]